MRLLTNEQQELHENAKICYTCKSKFQNKYAKDIKHDKVIDHCYYTDEYRGNAHNICNLEYSVPEEITIFFTMDLTMIIILS